MKRFLYSDGSRLTRLTNIFKYSGIAIVIIFICFVFFQYFYGGDPGIVAPKRRLEIVAHRGVHLNYRKGAYDRKTGCEAIHIFKPKHELVENTIESIGAAFEYGATIVEIDIRKTSDNNLVVFHDERLECKTNAIGRVADTSLDTLKALDIGYGYTFDNGVSYPFRGKWIGRMPTLNEVLDRFKDKKFLIDQKDGTQEAVEIFIEIVKKLPHDRQKLISYWGSDKYYDLLNSKIPAVKPLFGTINQIKQWSLKYIASIGLAGFPTAAKGLAIGIPTKYTKILWGWPYRFIRSVNDSGAYFFLIINSTQEAMRMRNLPIDGIVTDYIEDIGPLFSTENLSGPVGPKYLQNYLDEFTFRFNRRKSKSVGKKFMRIVQQAVN